MSKYNTLKDKTIKGFAWRFAERISSQLVGFIVTVILARLLMPSEYGIIALTMVFISISSTLTTSGLGASLIQKKDTDDLDFSTMLYSGLFLSFLMYLILLGISPFIDIIFNTSGVGSVLRVLGLVLPVSAINSIQQASVSIALDFKRFFYATFIGTIGSGIIGILMAYMGYGVWALVAQQLSSQVINTITLSMIISWRPKLMFSWKRFHYLFSFGIKMMTADLIGSIFNQLKNFIIGIMYKPADLAFYNRGENLSSMIGDTVNSTINSVLFPALSKVQNDKIKFKQVMSRSMVTSSFILCPLMFGLAAVADKVIVILLTDKWIIAVPFLQITCLQYCFSMLGTANLQSFYASGRSDIALRLEIFKKPFFALIIGITMFISPFAIACGLTLYSFLVLIVNMYPNKKLINYGYLEQWRDILPNFVLASIMAICIYFIGVIQINIYISLLLQIVSGILIYCLLARLFHIESFEYILSTIRSFSHNEK